MPSCANFSNNVEEVSESEIVLTDTKTGYDEERRLILRHLKDKYNETFTPIQFYISGKNTANEYFKIRVETSEDSENFPCAFFTYYYPNNEQSNQFKDEYIDKIINGYIKAKIMDVATKTGIGVARAFIPNPITNESFKSLDDFKKAMIEPNKLNVTIYLFTHDVITDIAQVRKTFKDVNYEGTIYYYCMEPTYVFSDISPLNYDEIVEKIESKEIPVRGTGTIQY